MAEPLVGVVMGSKSDWPTMSHTVSTLEGMGIPCEVKVMSAHRTPDVIIAAAGGAAHLAGVVASKTTLPVLGVPMVAWSLDGLDSLLSTVQMPRGVPVGTLAIGKAGAVNAAIFAGQILGLKHTEVRDAVEADRTERYHQALADSDPRD